jgi:hypothetical protein
MRYCNAFSVVVRWRVSKQVTNGNKTAVMDVRPLLWPSVQIFFFLVCEAIGTAATPGLLCQPRVIVNTILEKQMECRLTRETEVLGDNLPQRHYCPSQNPTWPDPDLNPGRRSGKPTTNRLSYGAAFPEANAYSYLFLETILIDY